MKKISIIMSLSLLTAAVQPAAQPADVNPDEDPFAPQGIEQNSDHPPEVDQFANDESSIDGDRIVGGKIARSGSAPWQVQLFSPTTYSKVQKKADARLSLSDPKKKYLNERADYDIAHRCGASYIGGGWIITAAHCVNDEAITYRRVRIGTQNVARGGKTYRIDTVVLHKGYRKNYINDIALIHIDIKNKALPSRVKPISLALLRDSEMKNGSQLRATGWGMTGEMGPGTMPRKNRSGDIQFRPAKLMQVDLKYVLPALCRQKEPFRRKIHPKVLCAGSRDGRDTCIGDSGGPLTRYIGNRRVLVGIVSYGRGCGIKGLPGIYTRVSKYSPWIKRARAMPKGTHKII